jgi:hypothetical protein
MRPISFIPNAIRSLDPECEFVYFDGTDEIRIDKSAMNITETQIRTEAIRLETIYDAQAYARNREEAYPSTGDQLDYIYHNGVAKWKTDMIDPVKTKYPKG